MQPDPARVADTRGWLVRAVSDLRAARHELTASPPLYDDILFHCQQAAEKSLKAFLAWQDVPFRKSHNLEEIGEQCLAIDESLRPTIDRAVPLTEYAWKYRYPGDDREPDRAEVDVALEIATRVLNEVLDRLPRETHP